MSATFDGHPVLNFASRNVVAVSADPHRTELLDAMMDDAITHDLIIVESIEHAYSRIKEVAPDMIFVLVGPEDAAACQLLSMLNIDRETCRIPVVTWMTRRTPTRFADVLPSASFECPHHSVE